MRLPDDWILERVISGGQTGADQAFLRAAVARGYRPGGMMPLAWATEAGPRPEFQQIYQMTASRFASYPHRTRYNVRMSDGTIICGSLSETGSYLTRELCVVLGKPYLHVDVMAGDGNVDVNVEAIQDFIITHRIVILNGAGNRESRAPGIGARVEQLVLAALPVRETVPPTPPEAITPRRAAARRPVRSAFPR